MRKTYLEKKKCVLGRTLFKYWNVLKEDTIFLIKSLLLHTLIKLYKIANCGKKLGAAERDSENNFVQLITPPSLERRFTLEEDRHLFLYLVCYITRSATFFCIMCIKLWERNVEDIVRSVVENNQFRRSDRGYIIDISLHYSQIMGTLLQMLRSPCGHEFYFICYRYLIFLTHQCNKMESLFCIN